VTPDDAAGPDTGTPVVVVVGAAILDATGRLLAARRSSPSALAGGWEFPGGKVEPGESDPQALHRELAEELGVEVDLGERIGGDWPLREGWVLRLWTARVTNGTPTPIEDHDELRWLEPGTWGSVEWLPADWPIVDALSRHLGHGAVCVD
jgi:8-oxo-dGTP diphosphatase